MSVDKAKKKTRRIYCKASCSKISSKAYSAKNEKHIKTKNNLLGNAKNFYDGRKIVIDGFKNGIFSFCTEGKIHKDDIRNKNDLINHEKLDRLISLKKKSYK